MLITDHGDEFDLNSGTIVLENGSQVKGMIISGTTRVNDDGIEYLFMSVPQQIIVKNKVFEGIFVFFFLVFIQKRAKLLF